MAWREGDGDTSAHLHNSIGKHVVFISHRGGKMKRQLADHLYHALEDRAIEAFLDKEELPQGHDVRPSMLAAARRSVIHVPIFTQTYAQSEWCLEELVQMTKSSNNPKKFPVFYDVKPEELTKKNGLYAKALKAHREKGKHSEDQIKEWETALNDASWQKGFELRNYDGFEGRLLQDLVTKIREEMYDRAVADEDPNETVGLQKRVDDVKKLFYLEDKSKVYFVLLWGMSGIGKTTLARATYNRIGKEFQAASFVEDCGEKETSQIQSQLLNDLLLDKKVKKFSEQGRLKRGLKDKEVLIILDDVKNYHSIEEVVKCLQPGSRILVTSRNRRVFPHDNDLSDSFIAKLYDVQSMDAAESLQLFCRHAFKASSPRPGFERLAETVSEACGGLPCSLKVLGRHVSEQGEQEEFWKEAIEMLRSNVFKEITEPMEKSYKKDLRKHEQEMFLDVSCFLADERRRSAEYFWEGMVVGCISGLQRLIEHCLVKVDDFKRLTMHEQVRNLGRSIVEREYQESGKCSRLWDDTCVMSRVLQSNQVEDSFKDVRKRLLSWENMMKCNIYKE